MKDGSFLFSSLVIPVSIRDGLGIECLSLVSSKAYGLRND